MPTSRISSVAKNPSGTAVGDVLVRAVLHPLAAFRISDGSEITPTIETTSDAVTGAWHLDLERQSNIDVDDSFWVVYEFFDQTDGGSKTYPIEVGSSDATLAASRIVPAATSGMANYLTRAAADALYQPITAGVSEVNLGSYATLQDGLNAMTSGQKGVLPAGSYTNATVTGLADIEIELRPGAVINVAGTATAGIKATNCARIRGHGGKLNGPGKGSAAAGSHAWELNNCPGAYIYDQWITGFYHGVRPVDGSGTVGAKYVLLNIDNCAFSGIFPKEDDLVAFCNFNLIGTTDQHHDLYYNETIAKGCRAIANHHEACTGFPVHVYSASATFAEMTFAGETFHNCLGAYIIDSTNASSIDISGFTAIGSTGRAVVLDNGVHDSFIRGTIKNSTGKSLESSATQYNNTFELQVEGGDGCLISDSYSRFAISSKAPTATALRLSAAQWCTGHLRTDNGSAGGLLYTSSAVRNTVFAEIYGVTTYGVDHAAGSNYNRTIGVCDGSGTADINDAGTKNDYSLLRTTDELTLALAAGATSGAPLRIPHGSAPTSPVDGDVWTTTAGIYVRINGATVGPLS